MRDSRAIEHEQAFVRAFILPNKQERCLYLLGDLNRREKLTAQLGHFRWLDPLYTAPSLWKVDPSLSLWGKHLQGRRNIVDSLRSKGAGRTCWVICHKCKSDGTEMEIDEALSCSSDFILSCIPGRLAYFKGEEETLLLERRHKPSN